MSETSLCYINFPDEVIYNNQECMFQYYVKKYGYEQYFTKMPRPTKINLYNYFVAIPHKIEEEVFNSLMEESIKIKILKLG